VALEINSSPDRLDLPSAHIRRAQKLGVRFVISTDAHEPEGLGDVEYGVLAARRGWLGPEDVLNTRPREELLSSLRSRALGERCRA
jgi:DNA polymerase (family 10)